MTALAANRTNVEGISPFTGLRAAPVAANVHIYQNALIAPVGGYWKPVTVAPGLTVALAMREVDNTGGLAGAKTLDVLFVETKRLVLLKNDVTNPILVTTIGGDGWLLDDQTVGALGAVGTHTKVRPWQFYEANRQYDTTLVWCEVL